MDAIRPESPQALADELRIRSEKRSAVCLGGAFSKDRQGGPLPAPAERISTLALNRVLKYEPKDLTISVEAGMRWGELTRLLADSGQMLDLDPPFADTATVGGVIGSNLCGPRRRQHGSVRDVVIGMGYVTTAGKQVTSGGMVVKNVAGLDLAKLMIGSLGTLAAITSVNFKVSPKPPSVRTFALAGHDLGALFCRRTEILSGVMQPAAIDVVNAATAVRLGLPDAHHLLVELAGPERVLARGQRALAGFTVVGQEIWKRVREWIPAWLQENPDGGVLRVSTRHSEQAQIMAGVSGPALARAGSGVIYAAVSKDTVAGSGAVVEFRPEGGCAGWQLWPEPGDALELMRQIKNLYDPRNILNPGRLYGRL